MSDGETTTSESIHELEDKIVELSAKLRNLKKRETTELSRDYLFSTPTGDVSLSDLFGDKQDLIIIQNMGHDCPYCTIYADGINGVLHHLEDRCAVALLSPDPVEKQTEFAASRGWKFRMVSSAEHGDDYSKDMGHWSEMEDGTSGVWPAFSGFRRDGESISRTGHSSFCPGDEFCVAFPLMQALKDSVGGWEPKYRYGEGSEGGSCCGGGS
tara:strand:- start:28 stop:663 length:636 start_codon:yes stop_codon:yes gene_type:complete